MKTTSTNASESYRTAFARNLGLVSAEEQERLRCTRVAVAGLGGVGGIQMQTLARMGIGAFNLADFDEFSLANMNRQVGATHRTVGTPKVEVMSAIARDINPDVDLALFPEGVTPENVEAFVRDADLVVDAIDFFSMDARRLLHRTARAMGKPVLFAAPLGFSATLHVFTAQGMSFDEYFDLHDGETPFDQVAAFAVGIAPRGTHWQYMDASRVDLVAKAGPSMASACALSAGLLTTETLAILLDRRAPQASPRFVQFDPYVCIYRRGRLVWGNRGPWQRLKRWLVKRRFASQEAAFNASASRAPAPRLAPPDVALVSSSDG